MAENFKKKRKLVKILGTKLSVHNCQLLTSTGVSSLDNLIGGGVPVGSMVVIEEDTNRRYADVLLRAFIAEGLYNGHFIHLISKNSSQLLKNLPSKHAPSSALAADEKMKIAWRYQHKSENKPVASSHEFNYSRKMRIEDLKGNLISKTDFTFDSGAVKLEGIISDIKQQIMRRGVTAGQNVEASVLRIVIPSEWCTFIGDSSRFVQILKATVRCSYSVIIIAVPNNISESFKMMLCDMADFVLKLNANQDSTHKVNTLYKDIDGTCEIKKIAPINTLMKPPYITQLGFKLKKTSFQFQKLHLPPNLSEIVNRISSKPMCSLEF